MRMYIGTKHLEEEWFYRHCAKKLKKFDFQKDQINLWNMCAYGTVEISTIDDMIKLTSLVGQCAFGKDANYCVGKDVYAITIL